MCAFCVSTVSEGWPIFILCDAGVQRREGQLTETLRSHRIPFRVLETVRGTSPVGGRARLHRRAWQAIRNEDLPGATIIEDGSRIASGFVNFLSCGGYLHANLTQLCHGKGRVWRWGTRGAGEGVRLRPLAASTGLASAYALSSRGAAHLLRNHRAKMSAADHDDSARAAVEADWPCDVARMGALVSVPALVEPPQWLSVAQSDALPRKVAARDVWSEQAADSPAMAAAYQAGGLRSFARAAFSQELRRGF